MLRAQASACTSRQAQNRRSVTCFARCAAAAPSSAGQCSPALLRQACLTAHVAAIWKHSPQAQQQDVMALKHKLHGMQWRGALAPFAAATVAVGGQAEMYGAVAKALDVYMAVLTIRVALTWFRNIKWNNEPLNTLRQFTDPYLNIFRGIIPSLGGMDISPMIGFFLLSFVRNQMHKMALYASV